jgi:hypothetical protein
MLRGPVMTNTKPAADYGNRKAKHKIAIHITNRSIALTPEITRLFSSLSSLRRAGPLGHAADVGERTTTPKEGRTRCSGPHRPHRC